MFRSINVLTLVTGILTFTPVFGMKGVTTLTVWKIKQQLFNYESYASVSLSSFTVPDLAFRSTWLLSVYSSNAKCEIETGFLSLQYGGYPVVAPLNETFPPYFHLHRNYLATISLKTDNSTVSYKVVNPVAGNWYAISALDYDSEKKIKQKGLGINCIYYLDIIHHVMLYKEIPIISVGTNQSIKVQHDQNGLFRFLVGESTYKYSIAISNCSLTACNDSCVTFNSCPIRLSARSKAFPVSDGNDTFHINCSISSDSLCMLHVEWPDVAYWQYLMVECLQPGNVSFSLLIEFEDCQWGHLKMEEGKSLTEEGISLSTPPTAEFRSSDEELNTSSFDHTVTYLDQVTIRVPELPSSVFSYVVQPGSDDESANLSVRNPVCLRIPNFGRFTDSNLFSAIFYPRLGAIPVTYVVKMTDKSMVLAALFVEPVLDLGGTLKLETKFLVQHLNDTGQNVFINVCLSKSRVPFSHEELSCPPEMPLLEISSEPGRNTSAKVYFPYPESGLWFVAMAARCYNNRTRVLESCYIEGITVNTSVFLSSCVDGKCASDGSCREYFEGALHISCCQCYNGYRGYGCTDSSHADSNVYQLISILLLTLSNLFFIPSIVLCIYRRFFLEAFIYFFTMFFSAFYHACDGHSQYIICIMPYNVLSYCDFLASIVSFWVTIITMARLPLQWTSFLYMVAILGVAMGVQWDRYSLLTFLVPSLVAGVIMVVSWALRCHKNRSCYPSCKRWLFFLLPGICFALTGLIIFAGLETEENYPFTHSVWHTCIALCIVFLLPPHSISTDETNPCAVCIKDPGDGVDLVVYKSQEVGEPPQVDLLLQTVTTTPNGDIQENNEGLNVLDDSSKKQVDSALV